jgi:hypothetical protein
MPLKIKVTMYNIEEKLPDPGTMIIADDGQWHILMYDHDDIGYEWEDDTPIEFDKWCYLADLDARNEEG